MRLKSLCLAEVKKKSIVMAVIWAMLASFHMPVQAATVSTEMLASQLQLQERRDTLTRNLLRDDVRAQLQAMDVSPADVENRINSMTPSELAQLETDMNNLPAGSGVLGTIVLILLIFILLDIAGVTDIFPGV